MSKPLRIIFAGTPAFAAQHLDHLITQSYQVVAVFTQPDRPAGRGRKPVASPVKQLADQHQLPVYQPNSLKEAQTQQQIAELNADLMIVVAYGLLLPKAVLELPRYGCFNVHASLLPRWRGAAPIQHSILAGDQESGISIMQMDIGLDTGDVLVEQRLTLANDETSASLHDKLADLGCQALDTALQQLSTDTLQPTAQDNAQACYAHKISKAQAQLDWQQPAQQLERQVRAYTPWPISYFKYQQQSYRVWAAQVVKLETAHTPGEILAGDEQSLVIACGQDALSIQTLQRPGGKPLPIAQLRNASNFPLQPGLQLTYEPA